MKYILISLILITLLSFNMVSATDYHILEGYGLYYNRLTITNDVYSGEKVVEAILDLNYDGSPWLETQSGLVWQYYYIDNFFPMTTRVINNTYGFGLNVYHACAMSDNDPLIPYPLFSTKGLPYYIYAWHLDCDYHGSGCKGDGSWSDGNDYSGAYASGYTAGQATYDNGPLGRGFDYSISYSTVPYEDQCIYPVSVMLSGKVRTAFRLSCPLNSTNIFVKFDLLRNIGYNTRIGFKDIYTENDMNSNWVNADIFFDNSGFPGISGGGFNLCTSVNISGDIYNSDTEVYNYTSPVNPSDDNNGLGNINEEGIGNSPGSGEGTVMGQQSIVNQEISNLEKDDISNKLNWQNTIITFIDIISSIVLLFYYIVVITLFTGFLFVKIPGFFKKIIDTFKEFGNIKRY